MDLRGIDLKLEGEMISWIGYRDSAKIIKAEILMNLQKLIWIGDTACNSSHEPFKVLWLGSFKILMVILQEEDCSRAVPGTWF